MSSKMAPRGPGEASESPWGGPGEAPGSPRGGPEDHFWYVFQSIFGRLLVDFSNIFWRAFVIGATIELLDPDNVQHASTESDVLDVDLSTLNIETAMYARIRFDNGEDGERIWLSPWFVD